MSKQGLVSLFVMSCLLAGSAWAALPSKAEDDAKWQSAQAAGTLAAYRDFIRANPGSAHLYEAGTALYGKVKAANSLAAYSEFAEEFSDFPEAAQARKDMAKAAGIESRFTFRQGKIGERYVPSLTNRYSTTDTYYVNGKAIDATRYHSYTTGGFSTDRIGYTAVYQIFNESRQTYVVSVRLSGTSSMSETSVSKSSWSGNESHRTYANNTRLSKTSAFLIGPDSDIKDQVVVGETQPADFQLEITDIQPVTQSWADGLKRALDGNDLKLVAAYLGDDKAAQWHGRLAERFTQIAKAGITVQFATGRRFDPDFDSDVTATISNHTALPVSVRYQPNFNARGDSLELPPGKSQGVTVTARGIAKDRLQIELEAVKPVSGSVRAETVASAYPARREERAAKLRELAVNLAIEKVVANMVAIPAGSYTMGSPSSEPQRGSDEGPQHTVNVSTFEMAKYETTFDEWDACVADGGCSHRPDDKGWGRGKRPVINVSFDDIQQYLAWINRKTGKAYRLPSEAEWEYAARAGSSSRYSTGDCITTDQANFNGNFPADGCRKGEYRQQTLPVGSFATNPWGLFDMHGNVWEWTRDCWKDSYNGAPADGSARSDGDCSQRVQRGGSWVNDGAWLRSAYRGGSSRDGRGGNYGFRLSRSR